MKQYESTWKANTAALCNKSREGKKQDDGNKGEFLGCSSKL